MPGRSATSRLGHRVGVAAQPHGPAARRRRPEGRHAARGALAENPRLAWRRRTAHGAGDAGTLRSSRRPGCGAEPATRRSQRHDRRRQRRAPRQSHPVEHRRRRRHRRTTRARHRQPDRRRSESGHRLVHGARTGSVVGDRSRRVAADRIGRHLECRDRQRPQRRPARHPARLVSAAGLRAGAVVDREPGRARRDWRGHHRLDGQRGARRAGGGAWP